MRPRPLFRTVAIVGVGLIGGSLGLALRKKRIAGRVLGIARRSASIRAALRKKAVHRATLDFRAVAEADLVILCSPVSTILKQIKLLPALLEKRTLVIDVGSSKRLIEDQAKRFLPDRFVGCHPMAGSEKRGVLFAESSLFEGAPCFLTRPHAKIEKLWRRLGARPVVVRAETHDRWVAATSHLPHVLAFALLGNWANPSRRLNRQGPNPSLRELARLAQSDPALWSDILLSNRRPVLRAIRRTRQGLGQIEKALSRKNGAALRRFLGRAQRVSRSMAS